MNVYSITFRKADGSMVQKIVSEATPADAITKAAALAAGSPAVELTLLSLATLAEGVG